MNRSDYKIIFECVKPYLPKQWNKVAIFYWEVNDVVAFDLYIDLGKGFVMYKDLGISRKDGIDIFMKFQKIMKANRKNLKESDLWTAFAMKVDSNGKFTVNYDYEYAGDDLIKYEDRWVKKHLKLYK